MPKVPEQETRGGDRVDWANAQPGQPLQELPPDAYPELDSTDLPDTDVPEGDDE